MSHAFSFFRAGLAGVALTAGMAVAAGSDSRFSDAEFEVARILPMSGGSGAEDVKLAYLWVYRSALGSQLQNRRLKAQERAELQRLCAKMDAKVKVEQTNRFDGYAIELAHGTGDTSSLSAKRRVVFFFWEERGQCGGPPSRGRIE